MAASYLEISLTQLVKNLAAYRRLTGVGDDDAKICAVVKADGYGLGLEPIARCLIENQVDMMAVFSAEQAIELAKLDPPCPILILKPIMELPETMVLSPIMQRRHLHVTIHHPEQLGPLDELARSQSTFLPVHLYLDTGMSRAGLSPRNLDAVFAQLPDYANLQLAGLYTHYAAAEDDPEFTDDQMQTYEDMLAPHLYKIDASVIQHTANSYAALQSSKYHRSMLRIGLGLYGYAPQTAQPRGGFWAKDHPAKEIRPIVKWMSRIEHVEQYPVGRTVGYNRTFTLKRPSVLAMVPVGYGDGYPTTLSNNAHVRVQLGDGQWAKAPVRGRVNMDQIVIDLTELPGGFVSGTAVEVYSNEIEPANALHKLAQQAQSSCYEMLCRLSGRIERRYV